MVTETKPQESNMLLKWKMDCMDVSKKCCENAKIIFQNSKCSGNFNKTCLQSNKNIIQMEKYLQDSKVSETESVSESIQNGVANEENVVNV